MSKRAIIFVDAGFLSKLSKYFGDGKYIKFAVSHHLIDCCRNVEYLKKEDSLNVLLNDKK